MSEQPEKKSKFKVVLFALILSAICSLLITAAAVGLKDLQLANMKIDKKYNILRACEMVGPKKPSREEVDRLYENHIEELLVDPGGNIIDSHKPGALSLFLVKKDGQPNGYILPVTTRGLWGKIQGYLAFENDGQTVAGFSVFSHSETPGLGGEIESAWFRKNFKGKKIINAQNQFVSVGIAKGKVSDLPQESRPHYVDGISGATLTGKYLSEGIRDTLVKYNPVVIRLNQIPTKSAPSVPAGQPQPENKEH